VRVTKGVSNSWDSCTKDQEPKMRLVRKTCNGLKEEDDFRSKQGKDGKEEEDERDVRCMGFSMYSLDTKRNKVAPLFSTNQYVALGVRCPHLNVRPNWPPKWKC